MSILGGDLAKFNTQTHLSRLLRARAERKASPTPASTCSPYLCLRCSCMFSDSCRTATLRGGTTDSLYMGEIVGHGCKELAQGNNAAVGGGVRLHPHPPAFGITLPWWFRNVPLTLPPARGGLRAVGPFETHVPGRLARAPSHRSPGTGLWSRGLPGDPTTLLPATPGSCQVCRWLLGAHSPSCKFYRRLLHRSFEAPRLLDPGMGG